MKNIRKNGFFIMILMLFILCISIIFSYNSTVSYAIEESDYLNYDQNISIDDNFEDDQIIVVLKHQDKVYNKLNLNSIFGNYSKNFGDIKDLFPVTDLENNKLVNKQKFKQIFSISLKEKGKDKVLQAIKILNKFNIVHSVEPKFNYDIQEDWIPSDTYYQTKQYGLNGQYGIDADYAWDITNGSIDIKVGVFETGVQMNHEDLNGRVVSPNFIMRDFDHGTHVAGIIGAIKNNNLGIAGISNATIVPLY